MEKQTKSKKSGASKSGNSGAKSNSVSKKSSSGAGNGSQENSMLEKFIVDSLKDIYYAEKQLLKALPKMNKAATTPELKQAFQQHAMVTQKQISRLDQVFEMMGKKAQGKKCEAMEGLIKESETAIEDTEAGSKTRDVALIMAAQKAEHYEIASYGGLVQITKTMGKQEVSNLLAETLAEEKEADQLLTDVAENNINLQAKEEKGEDDDSEESETKE